MSKTVLATQLNDALNSSNPPLLFDVRKKPAFDSSPQTIAGAKWKAHDEVTSWAGEIPTTSQVVVYCVHGHAVSQNAAQALSDLGFDASYLDGGIAGWQEAGFTVS